MGDDRFAAATEVISGVLGCRPQDLSPATPIGSLPQWDSIAHLSIILAVEDRIGRQLTAEEIGSLETVASFAALFAPPDEGVGGR